MLEPSMKAFRSDIHGLQRMNLIDSDESLKCSSVRHDMPVSETMGRTNDFLICVSCASFTAN